MERVYFEYNSRSSIQSVQIIATRVGALWGVVTPRDTTVSDPVHPVNGNTC